MFNNFNAMRVFLAFIILSSIALSAFGQSERPGYHYRVIAWEGSIKNKLYVRDGEEYTPLKIYSTARTPRFWHSGGNPFALYTKSTGANGQDTYTPAIQIDVPETIDTPLFILMPKSRDGKAAGYSAIALEDSIESCPLGAYRFINWTDKNIAGRLGPETFSLPPKGEKTIDPSKSPDTNLTIQLIEFTDPENKRLYSSRWVNQPQVRKLVLLIPQNELGRSSVKIKIIADYDQPTSSSAKN